MIRGVVLCGGESKRMGSDKGLLPLGDKNWATLAFHKLEQLNIPVCISINPMQLHTYGHFFSSEQLILDEICAKGPLKGLLSVHVKYPDEDLLLLACDMTEMDVDTLQVLLDETSSFPGFDFYVYARKENLEPLCALYPSTSLKKLYLELEDGNLSSFSMCKLIKKGNYKNFPITNLEPFSNHNTAII